MLPAPLHRLTTALVAALALVGGLVVAAAPAQAVPGTGSSVFVNEIHYDNTGADAGEAVEVTAPAGTDLSAWSIVRYNGNPPGAATTYGTTATSLGGVIADSGNGWGFVTVNYPAADGLQNGGNDGLALLNGSTVIQLLSYEGVLTASNGPAAGMTSSDIGVSELGTEAVGGSLQLTGGPGDDPADFTWVKSTDDSFGQINAGQTFVTTEPPADIAPTVSSTTPAPSATGVAVDANLSVTFSENVTLGSNPISVSCATSGPHTGAVTGSGATYAFNPDVNFVNSETCTAVVENTAVTDQDGTADIMAADYTWSFTTAAPAPTCLDPQTHTISQVQGSGLTSPQAGNVVTVEAVVTAIRPGLSGFFIEEEILDRDTSEATSEGIFVRSGATPPAGVLAGDVVQVTGGVVEFTSTTGAGSSQTQISSSVTVLDCGVGLLPPPAILELPVSDFSDFEHFEGMRVTMPQDLVISEYFNYGRFNEVVVGVPPNGRSRFDTPTAVQEPNPTATAARLADYAKRRITLDDARSTQNPSPPYFPGTVSTPFTLENRFRGGDTLTDVTGVMEHTFGLYRVHPTQDGTYASRNPRPAAPPAVGGNVKVASFNVLNYFLTPDNGPDICGGQENLECRGADGNQPDELTRQRTKIVDAIARLDADVVGLMEMENTPGVEPAADLVNGLNAATAPGTYAYIDTGVIGTDAIRLGFLYQPAVVTPIGDFAILDSSVDPRFDDTRSRPVLAQTFSRPGSTDKITVAVNHLKSKGSACSGDPDTGDGAGNCNGTRTDAAEALVDWLESDPTASGDPDRLIIGDLNSYDRENPIDALLAAGYSDLVKKFGGEFAYSYVFDGQIGYLDHGLANAALLPRVTGAGEWHINADEPSILDYDTSFKGPDEDALYEPNAYRSSDHDPVLIGLDMSPAATPAPPATGPTPPAPKPTTGTSAPRFVACTFTDDPRTKTRALNGDCGTDTTILVPNRWTLYGNGYTVTAYDPAGGHFTGAVVRNAGKFGSVRRLNISGAQLSDVCDTGADALRGIFFRGASGTIDSNRITDLHRGGGACAEGNGIEVRNAPYRRGGGDVQVTIAGNEILDYHKTGILVLGSVDARLRRNIVRGIGKTAALVQNGIQVGRAASGQINRNTVTDNWYVGPARAKTCAVLLYRADDVTRVSNFFERNQRGVCTITKSTPARVIRTTSP